MAGRMYRGSTTTLPLYIPFPISDTHTNKGRREPVARSATRPAADASLPIPRLVVSTASRWGVLPRRARSGAAGRAQPEGTDGGGQASGAAGRAQPEGTDGGGQGPDGAAASGGVPNGKTPLELWTSATMYRADNFSTPPEVAGEKYIGLYTFGFKNRFG